MSGGPCCAHLRVSWLTEDMPGGLTRGWWECNSGCGAKFSPIPAAHPERAAIPGDAERDRMWCAALIPEDAEVINRVTTRVMELRAALASSPAPAPRDAPLAYSEIVIAGLREMLREYPMLQSFSVSREQAEALLPVEGTP